MKNQLAVQTCIEANLLGLMIGCVAVCSFALGAVIGGVVSRPSAPTLSGTNLANVTAVETKAVQGRYGRIRASAAALQEQSAFNRP